MTAFRNLVFGLMLAMAFSAEADYSIEQIDYAATGRYDLLEQAVLDHGKRNRLATRDRHALCFAYAKTKQYSALFACLDQLETSIAQGDRRTRLFGVADATPTVNLMRAEALIEMARYPEALIEAGKAARWLKEDQSDDMDMVCNALAALSLASTLGGDEAAGRQYEKQLRDLPIVMLSDYATAKAMALARVRMALRDYAGVIAALKNDGAFSINVFLDKLFSGSFLTGTNNWLWVELPRAFMLYKAQLETGQLAEARAGFDRLLKIDQVKANGEIYWLLLLDRGRLAEADGDAELALRRYREAVEVVERQRASINTEANKIGFVGDKQELYTRIIALAEKRGQVEMALEYIERAKSRALIDLLAIRERSLDKIARSPASLLTARQLDESRQAAAEQRPVDMATTAGSKSRQAIADKTAELQRQDPALASLVSVQGLSAEEIRKTLRADEALLEFFGAGNALYGLALAGNRQQLLRLDSSGLDTEVRAFRQAIQEQRGDREAMAGKLFARLIQPFLPTLAQKNLLIVPHGALHYLPFSALQSGGKPLLAERSLRFLPSSSVQKYIRPPMKRNAESLLIFGNPDLGNPTLDLPSAEKEALAIADTFPNSSVLVRKMASESAFKAKAAQFGYLHIASHGQFKSDSPLESRLLLAPDAENDGSLTVSELYQIGLNADLVTLSACETGLGKSLSGDDVIGLTRGFIYAGASNIVSSLWEVDDEATAQLMASFYRLLKTGKTKQEALRGAQLDLRKRYPDPVFWAAFYITGEGV